MHGGASSHGWVRGNILGTEFEGAGRHAKQSGEPYLPCAKFWRAGLKVGLSVKCGGWPTRARGGPSSHGLVRGKFAHKEMEGDLMHANQGGGPNTPSGKVWWADTSYGAAGEVRGVECPGARGRALTWLDPSKPFLQRV